MQSSWVFSSCEYIFSFYLCDLIGVCFSGNFAFNLWSASAFTSSCLLDRLNLHWVSGLDSMFAPL